MIEGDIKLLGILIFPGILLAFAGCAAPPAAPAPTPAAGSIWRETVTGMEFVWVPAGCFQMGTAADDPLQGSDERQHHVCVEGFWLGRHEVTNGQFRKFRPGHPRWFIDDRADGDRANGDYFPVVKVSWLDARDYAEWLSRKTGYVFRLATEAEWEYGCRGIKHISSRCGEGRLDDFAWWQGNGGHVIHRVGTRMPNSFGLSDMSGNVWEWTCSPYDRDYELGNETRCSDNPAVAGAYRGGAYHSGSKDTRAATRNWASRSYSDFILGFRLVREGRP